MKILFIGSTETISTAIPGLLILSGGRPVIFQGEGTSLWTMTHSSDFAKREDPEFDAWTDKIIETMQFAAKKIKFNENL